MWVIIHHQYGISLPIPQMSLIGSDASGDVEKCRLFSRANRVKGLLDGVCVIGRNLSLISKLFYLLQAQQQQPVRQKQKAAKPVQTKAPRVGGKR